MQVRIIVFLSACSICLSPVAMAQTDNVLSGEVEAIDLERDGDVVFHHTASFDAAATRLRAERALETGNTTAAFGHYLAICSRDDAESCHQAAQIAEEADIEGVPPDLKTHLFERACAGGVIEACESPLLD